MRRALGLLCTLAACNEVFAIDETVLVEVEDIDLDDDDVPDVADNCVDIPNLDQTETDNDGLGDACDPCITGSNHNEDTDSLLDGCDNCPHVDNEDQANADGDDLGDACDVSNAIVHRRVRFDGFGSLANDWIPSSVDWVIDNDAVRPDREPVMMSDPGMWNRLVDTGGPAWAIEIEHELPPPGHLAGITTRQSIGGLEYQCIVVNMGGVYQLSNTGTTVSITPGERVHLRLRREGNGAICEVPGGPSVTSGLQGQRTNPGMRASQTTRFFYIDIVRSDP